MTTRLTHTQMIWASQHDWFSRLDEMGLHVMDYDGTYFEILWTGTFKQLREWAGY